MNPLNYKGCYNCPEHVFKPYIKSYSVRYSSIQIWYISFMRGTYCVKSYIVDALAKPFFLERLSESNPKIHFFWCTSPDPTSNFHVTYTQICPLGQNDYLGSSNHIYDQI